MVGQYCREEGHGFTGKWRGVHKGSHSGDINLVGQILAVPVIDELRVNPETDEEEEQNEKQGRASRCVEPLAGKSIFMYCNHDHRPLSGITQAAKYSVPNRKISLPVACGVNQV